MPSANKFMKNDRVEFEVGSRTIHGVLTDLDEGLRVIADGGKLRFTVPADRLRFSNRKLEKDPPHACDAWQVVSVKSAVGSNGGEHSVATISFHGQPALIISCRGDGAPHRTAPMNGDYHVVASFQNAIRQWLADHEISDGDIVDEEKFWLDFKTHKAPFGVLLEEAISEYFQGLDDDERDDLTAIESLSM